jgi:acetyl esterase/lipase
MEDVDGTRDAAGPHDGPRRPSPPAPPHRRLRDRFAGRPVEERAQALKERVYATFTGLAIVLVQQANADHLLPSQATFALAIGIAGISVAGFVADVIAHLAVHGAFPTAEELRTMLRVAGEALASASLPLVLLVLAWIGILELEGALQAAAILYVATLGFIGYLAVRRTGATWWKQLVALGILMALGVAVIGLQQLAHAH